MTVLTLAAQLFLAASAAACAAMVLMGWGKGGE